MTEYFILKERDSPWWPLRTDSTQLSSLLPYRSNSVPPARQRPLSKHLSFSFSLPAILPPSLIFFPLPLPAEGRFTLAFPSLTAFFSNPIFRGFCTWGQISFAEVFFFFLTQVHLLQRILYTRILDHCVNTLIFIIFFYTDALIDFFLDLLSPSFNLLSWIIFNFGI